MKVFADKYFDSLFGFINTCSSISIALFSFFIFEFKKALEHLNFSQRDSEIM